jgi:hypothetical protein
MKRILGCAAGVLLVGCAGRAVDVGSNHDTVIEDAGPGGWPSLAACQTADQLPIVGTWQGYMEKTNLPSRSDAVKLVISAANASHVCGTITMGTGTPPPVPTDPDHPSIPGVVPDGGPMPPPNSVGGAYLIDGSPLTILNGKPSLPRLQFEANPNQFWKPWCELQTPYLREGQENEWYCVPLNTQGETSWTPETGCVLGPFDRGVPVDCNKAALCSIAQVCTCTSTGCTVSGAEGGLQFDLRLTGDELNGHGPGSDMYLTRVR